MVSRDDRQTGSLTVADDEVVINSPGTGTVVAQLSGTFTATVTFEATLETGASPTWVAVPATSIASGTAATTTTSTGLYRINAAGLHRIRARCSAYTSGTIDVTLQASLGSSGATAGGTGTGGGTVDTELPAAAAGADTVAEAGIILPGVFAYGQVYDATNAQYNRVRSANSIPDGAAGGTLAATSPIEYNGATFDRRRNNVAATALASAARTTTQTVSITNYNARTIHVILNVTSAGTGSITLSILGVDPVSAATYTLLAGSAVTTNSTNIYKVGPALTASANAVANDYIPRTIQLVVTANNANSMTYSLGYHLCG